MQETRTEDNCLVIDDVRVFRFPATYARTPNEAINQIRDNSPWSYVYWDHDLGASHNETLTVYPVLMMVLETAYYGMPYDLGICYIHTDNPVGRDTLRQLEKYYTVRHIDASDYLERILDH